MNQLLMPFPRHENDIITLKGQPQWIQSGPSTGVLLHAGQQVLDYAIGIDPTAVHTQAALGVLESMIKDFTILKKRLELTLQLQIALAELEMNSDEEE